MTRPRQAAPPHADESELWFIPPAGQESRRRILTRDRVVTEALAILGQHGVDALSMRALATRLGVVPGALYRHVRDKEQLHDLVLDSVLAEVDLRVEDQAAWTGRIALLAHRLRTVLEQHPGTAGLLKIRDPLGPHSLALAEAFLTALQQAGLSPRETALAYSVVRDYTLGFALADRTTASEQRVRDTATRRHLHAFLQSLPAGQFPALAALGQYVWGGNRDQRFTAGLDIILAGLSAARQPGSPPPGP